MFEQTWKRLFKQVLSPVREGVEGRVFDPGHDRVFEEVNE
jgi:hypothetical protein